MLKDLVAKFLGHETAALRGDLPPLSKETKATLAAGTKVALKQAVITPAGIYIAGPSVYVGAIPVQGSTQVAAPVSGDNGPVTQFTPQYPILKNIKGFDLTAADKGAGWCEHHKVNHKPSTHCPYKDKADKGEKHEPAKDSEPEGYEAVVQKLTKGIDSLVKGITQGNPAYGDAVKEALGKSGILEGDAVTIPEFAAKAGVDKDTAEFILGKFQTAGLIVVQQLGNSQNEDGFQLAPALLKALEKPVDSGVAAKLDAALKGIINNPALPPEKQEAAEKAAVQVLAKEMGNTKSKLDWMKLLAPVTGGLIYCKPIVDGLADKGVLKKTPEGAYTLGDTTAGNAPADNANGAPPAPQPFVPAMAPTALMQAIGVWPGHQGYKGLAFMYDHPGEAFSVDDLITKAGLAMPAGHSAPIDKVVKATLNKAIGQGAVIKLPDDTYKVVGTGGTPVAPPAKPQNAPQNAPAAAPAPLGGSSTDTASLETIVGPALMSAIPGLDATYIVEAASVISQMLGQVNATGISYGNFAGALNTKFQGTPVADHMGEIFEALGNAGVIDLHGGTLTVNKKDSPTGKCPDGHLTYKSPTPHNCPSCGKVMQGGAQPLPEGQPATESSKKATEIVNADQMIGSTTKAAISKLLQKFPALADGAGITPDQATAITNGSHSVGMVYQDDKYYLHPSNLPPGVFGIYSKSVDDSVAAMQSAIQNTPWYTSKTKTAKAKAKVDAALSVMLKALAPQAGWKQILPKATINSLAKSVGIPGVMQLFSQVADQNIGYKITPNGSLKLPPQVVVPPHSLPKNTPVDTGGVSPAAVTAINSAIDQIDASTLPSGAKIVEYIKGLTPQLLAGPANLKDAVDGFKAAHPGVNATYVNYILTGHSGSPFVDVNGQIAIDPKKLPDGELAYYQPSADEALSAASDMLTETVAFQNATKPKQQAMLKALTTIVNSLLNMKSLANGTSGQSIHTMAQVNGVAGASSFANILQNAGVIKLSSNNYAYLNPELQVADIITGKQQSPVEIQQGIAPKNQPVQQQPKAPPPPPQSAADAVKLGPAIKSLFAAGPKLSGTNLMNGLIPKIQHDSPTHLTDQEAKDKALATIQALTAAGYLTKDTAGDYSQGQAIPTAPKAPSVAVPDMGQATSALGWNPNGKGSKLLLALNANGDDGQSLQDVLSTWSDPSSKPTGGVAAEMLDQAMEKGLVKRVPNSNPAKFLFTSQPPPPAPLAGQKPSGKCQKGHNTYKTPVPSNCPTCGTPMTPSPESAAQANPQGNQQAAPVPSDIASIPDGDSLTPLGSAKALGGIKDKEFFQDAKGQRYMGKPDQEGVRPVSSQVASTIGLAILGQGNTIPVKATSVKGVPTSIQPYQDAASDATALSFDTMTKQQKDSLVRERVYDWLIGNHDSKAGNFIVLKDGKILGVDKEQAFKFVGQDKLNNSYKPNPTPPIYNGLFQAFQDGQIDLDLAQALPVIEKIEAITDQQYLAMVAPYLDKAAKNYGWTPEQKGAKANALLKRKQDIRKDFEKYFGTIMAAKGQPGFSFSLKKAPAPAPVPQPAGPPVDMGNLPSATLPDATSLTLQGAANVGGAKPKQFYLDNQGKKFLFKPSENAWRAAVQQGVSDIASLILPQGTYAPVKMTKNPNGAVGTIQPWMPINQNIEGTLADVGGDFSKLPKAQLDALQREKVFDWLTGNHDGHARNVIELQDGNLAGVDKEQAFKFLGQDKLDTEYHPNQQYGEGEPITNTLYRAFGQGKVNLDPKATEDTIKRIEAIPDDQYLAILAPYIDGRSKEQPNPAAFKANLQNTILARKHSIRSDFEQFYTKLLAKQGKPAFKYAA